MDVNLVMFKRDGQRKEFKIRHEATTIGRGEECTLRVPLLNVSRQHCELAKGQDELHVRDLGSANGTYVNNKRIGEAALKAGDRLVIGPVVFTVQIDGVPREIAPVKTRAQKAEDVVGTDEDDIIELEADVVSAIRDDSDPISALEALAADQDEDEETT